MIKIQNIPFLRFTVALSIGIVAGSWLKMNHSLLYAFLILVTLFLLWINSIFRYKLAALFGVGVNLFFIATGILIHNIYNQKPEFLAGDKYIARIQEIPGEKVNSYHSVVEIHAIVLNDSIIQTHEKVMVTFAKCEKSKFLRPGQMIIFNQSPLMVTSTKNPYEFNYKLYLERQQIYRQVYLSAQMWNPSCQPAPFSFKILAEKARLFLLNKYSQQNWNETQRDIMSALTLGYKSGLDAEIKNLFITAGVMHVLAVSGLHVGILYLLLNFIFGFLRKQATGRIFFILVILIFIWGFAFIAGLSPSVYRAAVMFTFVVVGQNLKKQSNIYNTVSASAFLLLLTNPNNLFAAGFQLSYIAVLGIVSLQPKIETLFQFQFVVFRYFWSLIAVSVAAQIATFPLSAYYFNQFPVYFWLSNILVIPVATILIPLGILLLSFTWIPILSKLISEVINLILMYLIDFLEYVEKLPGSVIPIYFTKLEFILVMAIIAFIIFFINFRKTTYLKYTLVFLLLFLTTSLVTSIFNNFRNEIIVYNYPKQSVVHLVAGRRNYVISESKLEKTDMINSIINKSVFGLDAHPPVYLIRTQNYNDSVLYLNNGLIFFHEKIIYFPIELKQLKFPIYPDIIIGRKAVVENERNMGHNTTYDLKENGAYRKKWYLFGKLNF